MTNKFVEFFFSAHFWLHCRPMNTCAGSFEPSTTTMRSLISIHECGAPLHTETCSFVYSLTKDTMERDQNFEQSAVIKFLVKLDETGKQISEKLNTVYGEATDLHCEG